MKNGEKMKKKCSCSSQNVIVITIETCNKKTCDYLKNKFLKSQPASTQQVSVEDRSDNIVDPEEISEPKPPPTSSDEAASATNFPQRNVVDDRTIVEEENQDSFPPELDNVYRNTRDIVDNIRDGNTFRLPKLPARHHGPGCAMEVSILERHEDNCIYKKAPNENRNPLEDRVGSYECVGRLVFKTCENDLVNRRHSKFIPPHRGVADEEGSAGFIGNNRITSSRANSNSPTGSIVVNNNYNRNASIVDDGRSRSKSVVENNRRQSGRGNSTIEEMASEIPQARRSTAITEDNNGGFARAEDRSRNESGSVLNERQSANRSEGSYRRSIDSANYDPRQSLAAQRLDDANRLGNVSKLAALDDDSNGAGGGRRRSGSGQTTDREVYNFVVNPHQQIAKPLMEKKHYPGDNCKLHSPMDIRKQMEKLQNTLLDRNSIKALASSSKNFTLYIDEANQVPSYISAALGPKKNTTNFTVKDNKKQREASTETIITLGSNKSLPMPTQQSPSALKRFLAMFKRKKLSEIGIDDSAEDKSHKKISYLKY